MADTNYLAIILTAGLSSGGTLGGLWLSRFWTNRAATEDRDRHARYLAIRVVCTLDDFAGDCATVSGDNGAEREDGYTYPLEPLPELVLPSDVDWKSIEASLMYDVLSFPAKVQSRRSYVEWVGRENSFPPDHDELFVARAVEYGQLALETMDLSTRIRRSFAIPDRDPERDETIRAFVRDRIDRMKRLQDGPAIPGRDADPN